MNFYDNLKKKIEQMAIEQGLTEFPVRVRVKILTPEKAIGKPARKDFPLLKGKEHLIEADFQEYKGQAFTDEPRDFKGIIGDIFTLPLTSNGNRAIFISTLNAVMRYLQKTEATIHCKNEEPEECAAHLAKHIKDKYGSVRVGLVGMQPAMLDHLRRCFQVRILDLDSENIGKYKYEVLVEHGEKDLFDVLRWANVMLVTGSTVVNGTIINFLEINKPVIFYGTTVAGTATLMGLERFCDYGK